MKRILQAVLIMVLVLLVLFLVARQMGYMDAEGFRVWLEQMRQSAGGQIKVALAVNGLLVLDLFFPVPTAMIMTLSGMFFGPVLGTAVSFGGSMLSGILGFGICRLGGQVWVRRIVGEKDLTRFGDWFEQYGIFGIIISRPIPMLTEILSCLAGLSDLRFRTFFLASVLGHLPVCAFYGYIGSTGNFADPWAAIAVALSLPVLLALGFRWWHRRGSREIELDQS